MKNNHRTIFTQTYLNGSNLDEPTSRLIQYCYSSPDFQILSDQQNEITLEHYIRISMMMFAITLILEAASKLETFYSKLVYQQLSTLTPIPLKQLKLFYVEQRIFDIIQNQYF